MADDNKLEVLYDFDEGYEVRGALEDEVYFHFMNFDGVKGRMYIHKDNLIKMLKELL